MNANRLGEQIKEYRQKNSISQRELAEQLFVSDKTISRWELGKGLPDIDLLPKIAEVLGITIDELVGVENLSDDGKAADLEIIRIELEKKENLLREKEQQEKSKRAKMKRIALITAGVTVMVALILILIFSLIRPTYELSLVGITTSDGRGSCLLKAGEGMPGLNIGGKTLLGFVDEEYNYYSLDGFSMPEKALKLRALFAEEMPIFAASDSSSGGIKSAAHLITEDGIPTTVYTFAAGSVKGSAIQSRPVEDSGEMEGINVYVPSLGERFLLLSVTNRSSQDVNIRYRIENFSDYHLGLDYYTPSVTIKANSTCYVPVYFENYSSNGTFEGCDHYVILDQDIDEAVELEIYGYIYLADELNGIEILGEINRFDCTVGEVIDLSDMVVSGMLVNGSSTGRVKISNYFCDIEGKAYSEDMESATVSFAGHTATLKFTDPFENMIAFAPAANIESINGTNGAEYISAEYVDAGKRTPSTRFTVKGGAVAGMEVEAWIHIELEHTMKDGINLRIPTLAGEQRYIQFIVTNEGGQEISFRYYAENYGDKGGVDVTVAPGETETLIFTVNPGHSLGCNYALKLLSDVQETTLFTVKGFFGSKEEISDISMFAEANKTTFSVGESFSSDGLVIKPVCLDEIDNLYNDVVISNYTTDLDGYIFTAEDVGVRTVTVSFGQLTLTYEVTVVP